MEEQSAHIVSLVELDALIREYTVHLRRKGGMKKDAVVYVPFGYK